ncbi:hypothetical protein [Hydrogenophaga intermedia]|uniref:hypothetical protein n=1 Tax=Hydrogenophaga intermedia TaxID=65786 RepID=UPI002043F651|nr:hypothetical protein [Hydrogenophaga intermedia]MCM3562677.1 hypothetical protein [Hydrogenophaga intermedia]
MKNPTPRYISAVARNLAELQRAIHNRDAMLAIEAERAQGYPLLRLAYLALFNDYMAHAMKVFENGPRVASFWYLYRIDQGLADSFMRKSAIDVAVLLDISARLKIVRDTTHFHIDADSVRDTKRIWQGAGIKGSVLSKAIDDAWKVARHLQEQSGLPSIELLPEMTKLNLRKQVQRLKYGDVA